MRENISVTKSDPLAEIAYREKRHIGFTIFLEKLPPKIRNITKTGGLVILTAFFVFLLVTGTQVVLINLESETEALKIPYGIVYAGVPLSSFLMLLESLEGDLDESRREGIRGG